MDDLVRRQFRAWHCNKDGDQQGVVNFTQFCQRMYALHPNEQPTELKKALSKLVGLLTDLKYRLTCPDSLRTALMRTVTAFRRMIKANFWIVLQHTRIYR